MYSLRTSLIIAGMIVTGAARSVGVKLLYQLGFDNYLFVALLYLIGQSLSLGVYFVSQWSIFKTQESIYHPYERVSIKEAELTITSPATEARCDDSSNSSSSSSSSSSSDFPATELPKDALSIMELQPMELESATIELSRSQIIMETEPQHATFHLDRSHSVPMVVDEHDLETAVENIQKQQQQQHPSLSHAQSLPLPTTRPLLAKQGSQTGLTAESVEAVAWIHSIPYQIKPLIPGLFNLANAALKWASFVYVAASIAEMLMAGFELVLSVCVARVVRKRQVSRLRWAGVAVVALGLWLVHAADVLDSNKHEMTLSAEEASALQRQHFVGALLIIGQCVTAVGQDMAEELFLQEAEFPATLLLGMEGLYGLAFGIPLYILYGPQSLAQIYDTIEPWTLLYCGILTCIFTITGIFNIMTTGVTSSMTRNMWKNCRTCLVWILGLILFYVGGNQHLGEAWVIPDSFFVLGGFLIMLSGIYLYYKNN